MSQDFSPLSGSCTCGAVQFQLLREPIYVHCCHCTWCQRETGSAFVVNAIIETREIACEAGDLEEIATPTNSGKGQQVIRCNRCKTALWSHYPGGGRDVAFVRVGTLARAREVAPHVHIFTSTKQPWVVLPPEVPTFLEYYDAKSLWPSEVAQRFAALGLRG